MEKLKLTSSARARSRAATFVGDVIKLAVMLAFVFPFYRFRPLTLPILIVFCFASRKIIQGFAYHGMK